MNQTDLEYLFSLRNEYRSLRYDLGNTRILCEALGNPQNGFKSVLIAGTNGKGSVATWLAAMLPDAGLYTSPHLERLNERISVANIDISDRDLEAALEAVRKAASEVADRLLYPATYFELVTAAAFHHFNGRVAHAVLEVGMGGRLDSTNVVSQDASVITNIGYDHQEHLGPTLEAIAAEKAGIIKQSEPVILGPHCNFESIERRAAGRIVPTESLHVRTESLGSGFFSVDIETPVRRYPGLRPRLAGRHQIGNMKVALRTAECLEAGGWPLNSENIAHGINEAVLPARLEPIGTRPAFLIDGAHNIDAATALAGYLGEYYPEKVWLIFGGMQEKDPQAVLTKLQPHVGRLLVTRPSNTRAADPHVLAGHFPDAVAFEGVQDAIAYTLKEASPRDTILVTGSLYLAGEARRVLRDGYGPLDPAPPSSQIGDRGPVDTDNDFEWRRV